MTAVALAKGAAASGSTLTLIKGALKIMAWTKAKTAIVVGVGVLLAAGTTTITVKEIQKNTKLIHGKFPELDIRCALHRQPPQVVICSNNALFRRWGRWDDRAGRIKLMGIAQSWQKISCKPLTGFWTSVSDRHHLPNCHEGKYDYIANLPDGQCRKALQEEIRKKISRVVEVLETTKHECTRF